MAGADIFLLNCPPAGDRPHTISSAYEKGGAHQRPQLTPYTFEQPTIPENGTAIVRGIMLWREI